MAVILELSDQEFETIMINVLMALMDKEHSMQEQMGNTSGEMKTLRKKKKILEIKNSVTEMKNVFDKLLVVWTWLRKESELEDISMATSKTEKQREKMAGGKKPEQNIQEQW